MLWHDSNVMKSEPSSTLVVSCIVDLFLLISFESSPWQNISIENHSKSPLKPKHESRKNEKENLELTVERKNCLQSKISRTTRLADARQFKSSSYYSLGFAKIQTNKKKVLWFLIASKLKHKRMKLILTVL